MNNERLYWTKSKRHPEHAGTGQAGDLPYGASLPSALAQAITRE